MSFSSNKFLANIYLFKVNNRNSRKNCEICYKLTIKIPDRRQRSSSGVSFIILEHLTPLFNVSIAVLEQVNA